MKNGLSEFLTDPSCFELRKEYLENYERYSPYIFRTPTPFTGQQLSTIGANAKTLITSRTSAHQVHLIGVSSRGIPLATAITTALSAPDIKAMLSIVGKDGSIDHLYTGRSEYTVLVDNALVSGDTLEAALKLLSSLELKVDLVLYLFDREELDGTNSEPSRRIANEFNCEVASTFSFRDVIDACEDAVRRRELVEYGRAFGNASLKSYLSNVYDEFDDCAVS